MKTMNLKPAVPGKRWQGVQKALLLILILVLLGGFAVLSYFSIRAAESLQAGLGSSFGTLLCSFAGSMLIGAIALYQWALLKKRHLRQVEINKHLRFVNAAIEGMELGLTITDVDRTIIFVNQAQARMAGFEVEELIGRPARLLGSEDLWREVDWDQALGIVRFPHESMNVKRDGTAFPVQLTSNVVHDSDGHPMGMVTTCEDITGRKQAEAELLQHRRDLSRLAIHLDTIREQERSEVSSAMQHRIGSSLTALKLNLSMMELDSESSVGKHLERIHEMAGAIDDAIDLVRQISSQMHPSLLKNIGFTAAVEAFIDDFRRQNRIVVDLVPFSAEPQLRPDVSSVLYRVFREAMNNCEKHAKASKVRVEFEADDKSIVLRVIDNGIGIGEENVACAKTFGLLAITERAKDVGGIVKVSGKKGEGTTVFLEVPVDPVKSKE